MKFPLVSIVFAVSGLALLPDYVGAQTPFSSTQPPSPFNRSTGLPATNVVTRGTPVPSQVMPGGAVSGYQPGGYPPGVIYTNSGPIDPDHRLGRGDILSYYVVEDRDNTPHTLQVTDSGEVELPLGGRVKAAGKTTGQLASDIKSTLEREYYYHATVQLGLNNVAPNASKGKVYITGEVAGKGSIDLPADGQLTVSQAILQVGGFTVESDQKHVIVLRRGGPRNGIVVNVKAVLNGEGDKDVVLQPGDTIKVKKNFFSIQM